MYSSLNLFKSYLGISGDEQDEILTLFLESANSMINKWCGVDTFEKTQHTEKVYINPVGEDVEIFVRNKPVISIESIDGKEVSDYEVVNDRHIILHGFPKINDHLTDISGLHEIVYTAGFENIPTELQLAEMQVAGGIKEGKQSMGGITSYKLGDEQISYGNTDDYTTNVLYARIKGIISKYKNFKLNY